MATTKTKDVLVKELTIFSTSWEGNPMEQLGEAWGTLLLS